MGKLREFLRRILPEPGHERAREVEPTLAEAFQDPVTALSERANALRRIAAVAGYIALASAAVAGACYVGGWLSLPSPELSSIDIPRHVSDFFEPTRESGHVSSGGSSFTNGADAISSLLDTFVPILQALGGILLVFGVFMGIVRQSFVGIAAAVPFMFLPTMLQTLTGAEPEAKTPVQVNELVQAANNKNYVVLKQLLNSEDRIDDFSKVYVLAQAAILAHVKEQAILNAAVKDLRSDELSSLTRKLAPGKPAFTIEPQVAYALEKQTDGIVLNLAASRFEDKAMQTVSTLRGIGWFATLICVFFGVLAVGPLSLSQVISSRLRRLEVLFRQADPS
ncbi:hypothetical protein APB26_32240 [Pseudomonas aeruginosa]|uniref:hypothetical protein n=1 Tax=Pseudomonas aeruginosa TaxID=287 RepID=UPI00071BCB3B|nr:hypothetical protein [Pseudomonas aeruginosa]KSQ21656.1 hypothetical protein APB26_32240 [Pseudomonas aeruginosa]RPV61325.1 hypothetical protein IPC838_18570 [Pseudomonas aeruginosa]